MSAITPDRDRWRIPTPAEAAAVRRGPGDGDLARIAALGADRMHDSLVFLAGYAPGVLDVILTATEPRSDDERPADSDALEPYCSECGAAAGIFIGRGNEWLHYAGQRQRMSGRMPPTTSPSSAGASPPVRSLP